MASLKSEALYHYHAAHGTPLRARAFASIRRINQLGSLLAPLSNLAGRVGAARAVLDRRLGISRRRPLPEFRRDTLYRWFARRPEPSGPFPRGEVILLADSFTSYTGVEAARAAVELLERAGWQVRLSSGKGCCGRPALSKGLLDRARAQASAMLDRLAPAAERGVPIVGVEPSCLLTLRDEYTALFPGDDRVRAVAGAARLVQDLLVEAIDDGALRLAPLPPPDEHGAETAGRRILLHGHCHEKAVTGTASTRALLERIPGADVRELDAGCCGMAGSFGFESEHYELSLRIGGLRLFPAVSAEPPETLIAATGVSCRQQIEHGCGRAAAHPVELVHRALAPSP